MHKVAASSPVINIRPGSLLEQLPDHAAPELIYLLYVNANFQFP